jgi:hypothetical protein
MSGNAADQITAKTTRKSVRRHSSSLQRGLRIKRTKTTAPKTMCSAIVLWVPIAWAGALALFVAVPSLGGA